ncbi:metal-dependent transcriptional regulator [Halocalculus aciditolerans]|uniref:HTH dtxR-type domain-containing protein n=1 Tax=Halocalculus aciditolerans TaxID=1383812 RepID=A0A830FAU0_9EURY|nr:MarR family transcriptional regulator [Halocalculus aciditolerans]GGL56150.1 hypothetical protein GCM10009039_12900 [Halocalculus aciditolerans]
MRSVAGATRYLRALYELADEPGERVSTGDLSAAVDRSRATTTETVQRLEARGLVDYEAYQGVQLTTEGVLEARAAEEEYEVLRRFFDDVLDVPDPEREADAVAGVLSPDVLDQLHGLVETQRLDSNAE